METMDRKETKRRGASFSKAEIDAACEALGRVGEEETPYAAVERTKVLAKFRRMQESYRDNG